MIALASLLSIGTAAHAVEISTCSEDKNVPASVSEALDGLLTAAVDTEGPLSASFGAAPGAVLSLESRDWTYYRAAGVADPDSDNPISCEMAFQIGSNTKMMTAAVILQLQEEGALSLEDQLAEHLPEIAAVLPNGDGITLRQLANHTAGVFSYTDNAPDGSPGIMEGDIADPQALRRGYPPSLTASCRREESAMPFMHSAIYARSQICSRKHPAHEKDPRCTHRRPGAGHTRRR